MKVLTLLIASLAAFILGYSVAEYSNSSMRTYFIQGKKGIVSYSNLNKKLKIRVLDPVPSIQYISEEKPAEDLKSIPLETFLASTQSLNDIQKKQQVASLTLQLKDKSLVQLYVLPSNIKFDKAQNILYIDAYRYMNEKGSNESQHGDCVFITKGKVDVQNITLTLPW